MRLIPEQRILVPERRILAYVGSMMGGVALVTIYRDLLASQAIAGITVMALLAAAVFGLRPAGGRLARWQAVIQPYRSARGQLSTAYSRRYCQRTGK